MRAWILTQFVLLPLGASTSALPLPQGNGCDPSWVPTFGQAPGTDGVGPVALAMYDDGDGAAPYAGGSIDEQTIRTFEVALVNRFRHR